MANVSSSNGLEKYPKLRFPGFKEPWKATTLSAIFEKNMKKNCDGAIKNVICNSAKQGLIPQREYFDKDIANSDNTTGYYIIEQNDFVYNPRKSADAPYGPISSYKYIDVGIVSPLYLCFRAKTEINPHYYEWYFKSPAWHRYVYMAGDSGARHDRVSIKDNIFFAMPIHTPSKMEQSQIASFLDTLEARIEKQCALVESLKKYKRGLRQQVFPQKGETTPKLRFAGFTVPWEQHKVKNIAPLQRGFDLPTSQIEEGIYPVIMSNGIGGYHSHFKVKGPGIITGRSGTIGKLHYIESDYWPHNTTLWITDFYGNNQKFIYYMYQHLDLSRFSTGSGVPTLNRNDVHNELVWIPSVREQERISEHLTNLDRLITLHQRKLSKFQTLKSALLQQLFI